MDNKAGKAQTPESYALTSNDYEPGLKVLARIIARVHMKRTANRRVIKDEFPKDRK